MTHAGNTRNTKREIDNRKHRGLGGRAPITQVVGPEIKDHGVRGEIPDEIELRRRGENAARLIMSDVKHESESGRFLKSKVIPPGIACNVLIETADVTVTEHENDRGFAVGIGRAAGHARDRHAEVNTTKLVETK